MRHWRIEYIFMTTCYMYKVTIIIIISLLYDYEIIIYYIMMTGVTYEWKIN